MYLPAQIILMAHNSLLLPPHSTQDAGRCALITYVRMI